jgi:uncharacterized protein YjbJ (UPF0337 family)
MSSIDTDNAADKAPEQIQQEIEQTRSSMTSKLSALEQKLSPRQVASDLFDMARERIVGTGNGSTGMIDIIKQNPIPVALIGIGLGWLVFSGRSRQDSGRNYAGSEAYGQDDRDQRRDYGGPATGTFSTSRLRGQAADAAGKARDYAGDVAGRARDYASSAYQQARDTAGSTYSQVGERAGAYYGQARGIAGSAYSRVEGTMQENPLLVGGAGLAIGAAIGAILPLTSQEREYLGEAGGQLVEQANEMGREAWTRARETAEAAGRAALDEAESRLSGEGESEKSTETSAAGAKPKVATTAGAASGKS